MKILITTDWYAPVINGVVTSVLNLKSQLEEQGHEVRVLTLAPKNNGNKNLSHHRLSQKNDSDTLDYSNQKESVWYLPSFGIGRIYPGARMLLPGSRKAIQKMIRWKPDVVHSQCEFATFWPARKIALESGAVLLHTYHTVYEDYTHYFSPSHTAGRKEAAWFTRQILKRVDGVIAPTEKVRTLLERYGIETPVYTIPTGINCDQFINAYRRAGSKAWDAPTLITVGRLAKEKNLQEIMTWLADKRGSRYSWMLVGDGPDRTELENLSRKLGLEKRVFFAGMIKPDLVADWYQKGRVFVSASESETQGLTYLEALASGLPAVCRQDPCLDGVIKNGKNGWQYRNKREFFEALERLEYPGVYYEMSRQALLTAAKYDQKIFGRKVLEAYQSCLRQRRQISAMGQGDSLRALGGLQLPVPSSRGI